MKKHLHMRFTSIRTVLPFCVVLLCLCAVLTALSTMKLEAKSTETVRQYADVFISRLSGELRNNDTYMYDTITTSGYQNMYYKDQMTWIQETKNLQSTYRLLNKLSITPFNYFVYNTTLEQFMELTTVTIPFREYSPIRAHIREIAKAGFPSGSYRLYELPWGQELILTMWTSGEFTCGAWITAEDFLKGLDGYGGNNITQFSLCRQTDADSDDSGRYKTYQLENVDADFEIRMKIKSDSDLTWSLVLQLIQLGLLLVGMGALWATISPVHKNLLEPLQNLTELLNKYKNNPVTHDTANDEVKDTLDDAYTVLSHLGERLETLSLKLYETELEKRQLNINFRNLQIRPHFLINNLAAIHDMAQLNETEKIMRLTVVLSYYYRYVLRDCMDMVPIRQELRHMDNIIQVHQQWSGNRVLAEYHVADNVKEVQIPVLIVSTFLENSLKHAANAQGLLRIEVDGQLRTREGRDYLFIRIQDNGGGFPQEMLDCLARGQRIPETGGRHIGINNAVARIRLIYGDAASIGFSNYAQGARVEIWIPIGGAQNEGPDR